MSAVGFPSVECRTTSLVSMNDPDRKPRGLKLDADQRLAAMLRLEAGEKQKVVAADNGVTGQYISLLWKDYKAKGVEGIAARKYGPRPVRELTEGEQEKLRPLFVSHARPSALGLAVREDREDVWTIPLARKLAKREVGFAPMRDHMKELLRKWNIRIPVPGAAPEPEFGEDFYEYLKTPLAKQIQERERIAAEKWEKELAEREARARRKTAADDEDFPEFDPEAYEALRKKMEDQREAGEMASRQRTGKHSKSRAPTQKKKRRKKR